ncbi:MAG: ogr/Delta-like zinc finger family protein [Cycloclasticus sp.]
MARQQLCPKCKTLSHCVTTKIETEQITRRYFTCSNQPECGRQFVMIDSFSHYTYEPTNDNTVAKIKDLVSILNKDEINELKSALN